MSTDEVIITRFRDYLRIKTVQPEPDYNNAVKFLQQQAREIDLTWNCIEVADGRPVVIMSWIGSQPNLSSIVLNSHMDVVPVYPDQWSSDPFAAVVKDNGDIVARGSQDMKCVGMQYLEAIRRLKATGFQPLRSIHVTFVPDEEIGGTLGMKLFIKRDEFKSLNVGFALDEGLANPTESFTVFYSERTVWWFKVTFGGKPGHGSQFIQDTAAEKFVKFTNKVMEYRSSQYDKLKNDASIKLGDVTSINMTMLSGGVQPNVVPSELSATFDMRIAPTDDLVKLEQMLQDWLEPDCTIDWIYKDKHVEPTSTNSSSPWWTSFQTASQSLGLKLELEVFPAGTDSRFLRELGIPVLGFSPMNHTPILLHNHNEFLNSKIYLRGIEIYQSLIASLSTVK